MIDEASFDGIRKRMEAADEAREAVMRRSRALLKAAKQAIYTLHRGEDAAGLLSEAAKAKSELEAMSAAAPELRQGLYLSAMEEYAEATAFAGFLATGSVPAIADVGVPDEAYLGGLADLTGELMRRAVLAGTRRDLAEVERIHAAIEALHGKFTAFDFRNGDLRRKYDGMKYNLQKVEQVRYELSLGGKRA